MTAVCAKRHLLSIQLRLFNRRFQSTVLKEHDTFEEKENFRVLKIAGVQTDRNIQRRPRPPAKPVRPRYLKMKVDQDWTNVWPTATTFKASAVPFPVRQGFIKNDSENDGFIPDKHGNLELMKIPNFLHLTPPHIKKQCAALKELCTPWPSGLTEEKCEELFPLESVSNDFCFTSNNIRDPRARTVAVKVKLSQLKLDYHGRHKFIRLVGDRYNKETDEVTLTSDRCPLKVQNYDYIMYLLTVLYHESMYVKCVLARTSDYSVWLGFTLLAIKDKIEEAWEQDRTLEDMPEVTWEVAPSRENIVKLLAASRQVNTNEDSMTDEDRQKLNEIEAEVNSEKYQKYKSTVLDIENNGETESNLVQYKEAVLNMYKLPKFDESVV